MNIIIDDDICWICGDKFSGGEMIRTTHHSLPTHLKPVKNILVPVHEKCHDRINEIDFAGIKSFAHKILKNEEESINKINKLLNIVDSMETMNIGDIINKNKNKK